MKKEKWHRMHTWTVRIPYNDVHGRLTMDTIRISNPDEKVTDFEIMDSIGKWCEAMLGYQLSDEKKRYIAGAGWHGFA